MDDPDELSDNAAGGRTTSSYDGTSRNARSITRWDQLSAGEQNTIGEIVTEVIRTHDADAAPVNEEVARAWFDEALSEWEHAWKPQIGSIKTVPVHMSCTIVGTFKCDLPAGSTQLAEVGKRVDEVYKKQANMPRRRKTSTGSARLQTQAIARDQGSGQVMQKYSSRMKGAPAFMRPGIQRYTGAITFEFLCGQGRKASAEYIEFTDGELTAKNKMDAIQRWDNVEFRRLTTGTHKLGSI